ncbi:MAG TPA: amidohydrolase family protein [Candidatus Sulfotelmatobacter sp.]|jgi:cytosine deaminase|nr:amidohydrolase family protein [Candidatus Sulfotelmatobacter sp.]
MKHAVPYYDLKQEILQKIKKNGGWVNAHAHFDRAYTVTKATFRYTGASLQEKWNLNDDIKMQSTVSDIYDRMARATECMIAQGVTAVGTFIDVDDKVKDKAIKAAQKLQDTYKNNIEIKYINQIHYGVLSPNAREWFEVGAAFVDIIGGLPERDKGHEAEHLDILFETAKRLGKMAHVHIDQFNDPNQHDTELLAKKIIEHGLHGKVVGIHGISIGAQEKEYRQKLYKLMKKADLMMIASPLGWIDTRRNESLMPFHNALTPVDELVPAGITIALGTDNIADIYKPFITGDMWEELHTLLEAAHFYEVDELVKIATSNGRKALGIT